jgi:hypothetical protein
MTRTGPTPRWPARPDNRSAEGATIRSAATGTCQRTSRWCDRSIKGRETLRGTQRQSKPWLCMELAPRKPSWPAVKQDCSKQAGHMDASDPITLSSNLLRERGRPHMGSGFRRNDVWGHGMVYIPSSSRRKSGPIAPRARAAFVAPWAPVFTGVTRKHFSIPGTRAPGPAEM